MDEDCVTYASANGILHCLKFLAQEAASLNLLRTLSAIEDALEMAQCESRIEAGHDGPQRAPAMPVLH